MRHFLFLALLLPTFAGASHGTGRCNGGDGSGALGIFQVGDGTPERTLYLDDRNALMGNGIWVYAESNGVFFQQPRPDPDLPPIERWWTWLDRYGPAHENLQRGGEAFWSSSALPEEYRDADICTDRGDWAPDTLVF